MACNRIRRDRHLVYCVDDLGLHLRICHGVGINGPALVILLVLTALLVKGTQESATVNSIIVAVKVTIVLVFIVLGWRFMNPANHTPFFIPAGTPGHLGIMQHGFGGMLRGAGIVFFAFIGFDAVSTAAQETKNPGRDMPKGILGSLAICTVLYILFGYVLTGVGNWTEFLKAGKEASVAYAVQNHMPGYGWLATAITVAILFGFSSVILVMLLGQSRVFYSMATDGLLPKIFSDVHPKFCTPYKCKHHALLFCRSFGWLSSRIAAGRPDFHRNAVCVCAGLYRYLDLAPSPAESRPALPHSAGSGGPDPGRHRLQHHDSVIGRLHSTRGAVLDAGRFRSVFPLR
jgi:APA family basic amino acid/polyamine antiporter